MSEAARSAIVLVGDVPGAERPPALAGPPEDAPLRTVVERTGAVVDHVVVACLAALEPVCREAVAGLDARVVASTGSSPAARIGAGLDTLDSGTVAVVAGDMADLDPAFLTYLFDRRGSNDAVVPLLQDGTPQPAQAVYDAAALAEAAATAVATGDGSMAAVLDGLTAAQVPPAEVAQITTWASLARTDTDTD